MKLIFREFDYCLMSSQRDKDDPFIIDQRKSNLNRSKKMSVVNATMVQLFKQKFNQNDANNCGINTELAVAELWRDRATVLTLAGLMLE